MKEYGLERGKEGLEVYVMCEIPSNVILGEQFAEIFDGFSIGSNDLTQLTLGVDRDSNLVAHLYDERNEAVKKLVAWAIENGKRYGKKVGICGQAPSDHPDFAKFLVEKGIDSISINPDSILEVIKAVYEIEKNVEGK
jgi:pyruvate,water dikinase